MQPVKCLACGGSSFEHGRYIAELAVLNNPNTRQVPAKCSVCLGCGYVAIHLDDAPLDELRAHDPTWKGREVEI